jgi:ABC-2 type transport system ATP-binding protein
VTADHVIVVGKGRLLRDQPMADFIRDASVESVHVRTPEQAWLAEKLRKAGAIVTLVGPEALTVERATSQEVGTIAGQAGITLWELSPHAGSLEDAYLALTRDTLDFQEAA